MPTVIMMNHQEKESLAEILRLFFGDCELVADNKLVAGDASTPIIISKVSHNDNRILNQDDISTAQDNFVSVITSCDGLSDISSNPAPDKIRREIKRQLYCQLEKLTSVSFPWGSLTGVRPTMIISEVWQNTDYNRKATLEILTDFWRLSPEKAKLGLETALAENSLLTKADQNDLFVYIGIPFCPTRCSYCSFISRDAKRQEAFLAPYVDAVIEETKQVFANINRPVKAIYIGGGTPTSLPESDFYRLLEGIARYIPLKDCEEWTVEAGRPDTVTDNKLKMIRQAGADRICINPQTMHDFTLEKIGRCHTTRQTIDAFSLARKNGFKHINMDLIAGLPGEKPDDLLDSVRQIIDLSPESITLHSLAIKRSAWLQQNPEQLVTALNLPDHKLIDAVEDTFTVFQLYNYLPYYLYRQKDVVSGLENTGFARPGKACLYNVAMMSDKFDVIGIGSGAISKKVIGSRVKRSPNSKDLLNYQQRVTELADRKLKLFSQG